MRLVARSRGQVSPQGPAQLQGHQAQGQAKAKAEGRYKGCPEASAPAADQSSSRARDRQGLAEAARERHLCAVDGGRRRAFRLMAQVRLSPARPRVGLRPTLIRAEQRSPGRILIRDRRPIVGLSTVGLIICYPLPCRLGGSLPTAVSLASTGNTRHCREWQQ